MLIVFSMFVGQKNKHKIRVGLKCKMGYMYNSFAHILPN